MRHALVRRPSIHYDRCIRDGHQAIDVALAREQHAAYVATLRALGVTVTELVGDASLPDCCFVEDAAVIVGADVLITRMAQPSRRGEATAVADALDRIGLRQQRLIAPATLDGGDVLAVGDEIFVGLSTRTNAAAVAALASLCGAAHVHAVEVRAGLHLKSAVTQLGGHTLVCHGDAFDVEPMRRAGLTLVPVPEPEGANVLVVAGTALVSAAAPRTAELIAARGFAVRPLDISEFHKGDGALTCLSLRWTTLR